MIRKTKAAYHTEHCSCRACRRDSGEFGFDHKAVLDAILANRALPPFHRTIQSPGTAAYSLAAAEVEGIPFQVERFQQRAGNHMRKTMRAFCRRISIDAESYRKLQHSIDGCRISQIRSYPSVCCFQPTCIVDQLDVKNSMVITYHAFTYSNMQVPAAHALLLRWNFFYSSYAPPACRRKSHSSRSKNLHPVANQQLIFLCELFHFPVYICKNKKAIRESA